MANFLCWYLLQTFLRKWSKKDCGQNQRVLFRTLQTSLRDRWPIQRMHRALNSAVYQINSAGCAVLRRTSSFWWMDFLTSSFGSFAAFRPKRKKGASFPFLSSSLYQTLDFILIGTMKRTRSNQSVDENDTKLIPFYEQLIKWFLKRYIALIFRSSFYGSSFTIDPPKFIKQKASIHSLLILNNIQDWNFHDSLVLSIKHSNNIKV